MPFSGMALWFLEARPAGLVHNYARLALIALIFLVAALLTSTKRDKDRTALYLNECRRMSVDVLVPDVNESEVDFTVTDGKIRFGLSAVRNVGEGVVEKIVEARKEGGPFADFPDFVERVEMAVLNKRTIESMIKAGAFDSVGHTRKGLLLRFDEIIDKGLELR